MTRLFLLLLFPTTSFAFFCPTNFAQINVGDSIEAVTQQCGKPSKQETKEVKPEVPQEWNYFISRAPSPGSTTTNTQGTLKLQIVFDANGKVINMSVNGLSSGQTAICGNSIQVGDMLEKIKATCGSPTMINKQDESLNTTPPKKITTFTYNTTPESTTLTFEDGKLIENP